MLVFALGLVGFLGIHSVRVVAEPMRTRAIERLGLNGWKGLYSLIALASFGALAWGYSIARATPTFVWSPPRGMAHAAGLLTLIAFVLFAAAYVPKNQIKARLHHPMTLSIKVWAFAHLLANGSLEAIVLFGSFLVWAILAFRAARMRDRAAGTTYPAGTTPATIATVIAGAMAWVAFAFWGHAALIGVRPFGV
jgi:uncharacterized membrane protein